MKPLIVLFSYRDESPTADSHFKMLNQHMTESGDCIFVKDGCGIVRDSTVFNALFESMIDREVIRNGESLHVFELGEVALGHLPLKDRETLQSWGVKSFDLHVPQKQKPRQSRGL